MIKPGIARTVRRAILRVLPALLLILAFLNLGWLMLAAPVSAEQTGSPNLFAGIAAGVLASPPSINRRRMTAPPTQKTWKL